MSQQEIPSRWQVTRGRRRVYTFAVLFSGCSHALKSARGEEWGISMTACSAWWVRPLLWKPISTISGRIGLAGRNGGENGTRHESRIQIRVLAKLIDYNLDFSRRPCQTFAEIFNYRNLIAHARTESLTFEEGQVYDFIEGPTEPETKWDKRQHWKRQNDSTRTPGSWYGSCTRRLDLRIPTSSSWIRAMEQLDQHRRSRR